MSELKKNILQRFLLLFLLNLYYFASFAYDTKSKSSLANDGHFLANNNFIEDTTIKFFSLNNFGKILTSKSAINYQFIRNTQHSNFQKLVEGEDLSKGVYDILNLKQNFINASFSEPTSLAQSSSFSNFFIGNNPQYWKIDQPNYDGLHFQNIYPKIDLKIYSSTERIKYDIILKPGFDLSDLKTNYEGAEKVTITDDGLGILIVSKFGIFKEHIPEVFQIINNKKILIECKYTIKNKIISYEINNYNANYDIVIDPTLIYSSYFGSVGDDYFVIGDIAEDITGNIYTTGSSTNLNFPTTPGSYNQLYGGGLTDIFLMKFDASGTLLASTFIGGNDYDFGFGIDVDMNGNPILGGDSWSGNFPTTPGTYQPVHSPVAATNGDITITRFTPSLNTILNSTFVGGNADEQPHELVAGSNGNIYLGGQAKAGMPTTAGCYQTNCGGDYDYFATILDANLINLLASTYIGNTARDRGNGIAIDNSFNVYLTGYVEGAFPTTPGAFDVTINGGTSDVTVVKFNPTLTNLVYSTYLGSSGADLAQSSIEVVNNEAIVVGTAGSVNFPTTPGAYSTTFSGGSDVFITKLNANGAGLVFSTLLGSPNNDQGWNIYLDPNGNIGVTGNCANNFPITTCAYDNTFNGGTADAFISIFNNNCSSLLYSSYFGGSLDESGRALKINGNQHLLFGNTSSADIDMIGTPFDNSYNGTRDIFVAVFDDLSFTGSFTYTNSCSSSPVSFSSGVGIQTASWNFGDSTSGSNNTSNLLNPTHLFTNVGLYTITLIASNNCATDTIVQLLTIVPSDTTSTIEDTTVCIGSSLLLTATGGTSFVWNNGITSTNDSVVITPSTNTQYIVTAQTAGCNALPDTVNVTIIQNSTLNIIGDSIVCSGNTLTLTAAGTTGNFQWSGPISSTNDSITFTPLISSFVYLQEIGGVCSNAIDSLQITVSNSLVTNAMSDTIVCPNSNITLTVTGGSNYIWNNGITSNNDSVLVTINNNTQFIVYAQSVGCPSFPDTINVTVSPIVTATITGDSTVCLGQSITLYANGNATGFQWTGGIVSNNDTVTINPVVDTIIYLQGNTGLCNSAIDSVNIVVSNIPSVTYTYSSILCANSNINFNAIGNNVTNYYWNFGDSLSNPLYYSFQQNPIHAFNNQANFLVSLIGSNSCGADTSTQLLAVGIGPNANLPEDSTICVGQQITLISTGGTQYNWSGAISSTNDSITISPASNSIYTLTISNGVCFGLTDTIIINVEYPSNIKIIGDNNLYCPGDSVKLYGSGANNIVWDIYGNLIYDNQIIITPNTSGMVWASNFSNVCPVSRDSFFVNVAPRSEANFSISIDSCLNIISLLNNSTGASTYKWQVLDFIDSDALSPQFEITESTAYEILLITNPNSNCADSSFQKIFIDDNFGNHYFIPNTFTPNNDGLNDEFIITTWNQCRYFKLYIYNRWGNQIHFTEGTSVKWNGIYEGLDAPIGVYVYLLQIGEQEKTGTVTLFR